MIIIYYKVNTNFSVDENNNDERIIYMITH